MLEELSLTGCLHAEIPFAVARHLIFGALHWSVQWFEAKKGALLDDLTDAVMVLFIRKKLR